MELTASRIMKKVNSEVAIEIFYIEEKKLAEDQWAVGTILSDLVPEGKEREAVERKRMVQIQHC